ncbi:MAG: ferritin-like domain-containing protein [Ferruginibacter sp.]
MKKSPAAKSAPKKSAPAPKKAAAKNSGKIKAKPDAAEGLRDLFIDELKDIYWAEKALTKALPKMAKNATNQGLKNALQKHLVETQNQIVRLEHVFVSIGEKARAKKCEAMAGLIKEGEGIMEDTQAGVVRDAGIISAGQKTEHYEIASYGTLCAFAKTLGLEKAASLLAETLEEEKAADSKLSEIAGHSINIGAASADK